MEDEKFVSWEGLKGSFGMIALAMSRVQREFQKPEAERSVLTLSLAAFLIKGQLEILPYYGVRTDEPTEAELEQVFQNTLKKMPKGEN